MCRRKCESDAMSSQAEKELQAGISIFSEMCSKVGLTCTPASTFHARSPVRFDLSNGSKELRVEVGYEFITDLPGTKEFQSALWSYLTAVTLKFPQQSFAEYGTLSGIPIMFDID